MKTPPVSLSVGLVLFEGVTQLDFTGPYEVFSRMPGAKVRLVAELMAPVRTEFGLVITPDATFDDAPALDVICVPGGWGVNEQLENDSLRKFLRVRAAAARYVTSVCTGALLLGAAGLLDGYSATTHWMSVDFLRRFGATHVDRRVVVDRNRITGGGVTAGIDLALVIAAELYGDAVSQAIQLAIEYQPAPPFNSGSPNSAPAEIRDRVLSAAEPGLEARRNAIERIVPTWSSERESRNES
jgi:cyclohexyl-isocyanide hydratase